MPSLQALRWLLRRRLSDARRARVGKASPPPSDFASRQRLPFGRQPAPGLGSPTFRPRIARARLRSSSSSSSSCSTPPPRAPAGRAGERRWARKWPRRADAAPTRPRDSPLAAARRSRRRSLRPPRASQLFGKGMAVVGEGLPAAPSRRDVAADAPRRCWTYVGGEREGGTCAPASFSTSCAPRSRPKTSRCWPPKRADLPADALDDGALAFALLHAADRDGDGRLGLDDLQVYCAALAPPTLRARAAAGGAARRRGARRRTAALRRRRRRRRRKRRRRGAESGGRARRSCSAAST